MMLNNSVQIHTDHVSDCSLSTFFNLQKRNTRECARLKSEVEFRFQLDSNYCADCVSLPLKQTHAIRETQYSSIKTVMQQIWLQAQIPPAAPEDLCVSQWTTICINNIFL